MTYRTFRLSEEARGLLLKLSRHFGLTMTGILEWLIREKARDTMTSRAFESLKRKGHSSRLDDRSLMRVEFSVEWEWALGVRWSPKH